jgi:hypothetical protein
LCQQGVGTPFAFLLPFVEQDNLFKQICPGNTPPDVINRVNVSPIAWNDNFNSYSIPVKTYICPSDPSTTAGTQCKGNPGGPPYAAATTYAFNALVFDSCTYSPGNPATTPPVPPSATVGNYVNLGLGQDGTPVGPFNYTRFSDITDGVSNTVFYTEKLTFCMIAPKGPAELLDPAHPGQCNFPGGDQFCGGNNWSDPLLDYFAPVVNFFGPGLNGTTFPYALQVQPKFQVNCDPTLPSSAHTGVIITAMGDGSVRTVASSIAPLTWFIASVPNDGVVLPSDW